ncbi:MAG: trypsin-like serine protease [Deltaproteobacteria bacterium]|nr:trypsin-like serine protease [Deltaproteobacteria bacterium]
MDLKLTFQNGPRIDKSVDFKGSNLVNLGSKEDNDMVFNLPEDIGVSAYHTQIRQIDDIIYIQDMGSAGGTFLNGQRISKTQLSTGDSVQMGIGGPRFTVKVAGNASGLSRLTSRRTAKVYGQKTVGMMIEQALKSAGKGVSKTTSYFESMLEERLNITTRKYRMLIISALALLLLLGVGVGIFVFYSNQFPPVRLLASESDAAERIAKMNRYNVFLMAGLPKAEPKDSDHFEGFCSAFSIGPNLLATNAHCVEKADRDYQSVWALMNEAPKNRYKIKKMLRHPLYSPGEITPDVGLLEISSVLETYVQMANQEQLKALEQGTFVYLYGFPGRLSNLASPVASFVRGEIGRITTIGQRKGDFSENILLQHSAMISEGTSGSPMFNLDGSVVGINAGGYAAQGKMMTGYNFGIRIDTVAPLLQAIDASPDIVK